MTSAELIGVGRNAPRHTLAARVLIQRVEAIVKGRNYVSF